MEGAFNKDVTKRSLQSELITQPRHIRVRYEVDQQFDEIATVAARTFGQDFVIKPNLAGSSVGVIMASGTDELVVVLEKALPVYRECLVEERIRGIEATVGILEDFRDTSHYILPPVEIIPPSTHDFFAADVKYNGATAEICPGRFSYDIKEKLQNAALTVHKKLGLSQYSRSDFMIRGDDVYFLEVNTLPGLTPISLFPKASEAIGLSFNLLIDHLVRTAKVR